MGTEVAARWKISQGVRISQVIRMLNGSEPGSLGKQLAVEADNLLKLWPCTLWLLINFLAASFHHRAQVCLYL